MITARRGDKEEISFMGYCPFCGRPMTFFEEHTRRIKHCPVCDSPIAFEEFVDFEKESMGYNIVPNVSGESFEIDGYSVRNGTIVGYAGDATSIVTPPGAIAIGKGVFQNNQRIKSVIISPEIKHIGAEAFHNCENIRELTLSEGIVTIGNMAFRGCRRLEQVSIPSSLRAAGYALFHSCDNLTELLMPMDMKYLAGSPYGFCKKLKIANVPHCVTDITSSWFQYNDSLLKLYLGRGVTRIQYTNCPSLQEAYLSNTEGWFTDTWREVDRKRIPDEKMANPKTAAVIIKKYNGLGILIPDKTTEKDSWIYNYWLKLE